MIFVWTLHEGDKHRELCVAFDIVCSIRFSRHNVCVVLFSKE